MMSRNIRILATVIAVLLSIAACVNGPTGQSNDRDIAEKYMGHNLVPPPPQRSVFSYSLIRTTWEFRYVGIDKSSTTVDFLQDGRFHERMTNSEDGVLYDPTPNDDEWEQDGPNDKRL